MRQRTRVIAAVLALFFVVGCAGMQLGESQSEIYFKALGVWYDTGMQYKTYYSRVDEETKIKWDNEFRPKLIMAKEVLNLWKFHMQNNDSTVDDMQKWKDIKNELLLYIATHMTKEGS